MKLEIHITHCNPTLEKLIMGTKADILESIAGLKTHLSNIDSQIEALFELVKANAPDIKPEVADELLAALTELKTEADKIVEDDPNTPPPPV